MGTRLLLRADLTALANTLRHKQARRDLGGTLVSLVCVALGGVVAGGRLVLSEPVLAAVDQAPELVTPLLLGALLLVPMLFAVSMGFGDARRLLFGSQTTELLLTAPVPRSAIVSRAWLYSLLRQTVILLALGWPAVWGLVLKTNLGVGAALAYPLLAVLLLAPCTAAVVMLVVALRRWAGGSGQRIAVNVIGGLVGIGLALLAGAGLITQSTGEQSLADGLLAFDSTAGGVDVPGRLLAWAGEVLAVQPADFAMLALPLLALPLLAFAKTWLSVAYERGLTIRTTKSSGRHGRIRRWPHSTMPSIRRKDMLAAFKVHTSIAALGLFTAVAVMLERSTMFGGSGELVASGPAPVAAMLGMFNAWIVLLMVYACVQGASWLSDETSHYDLIACAPIDRRALLLGKLPGIAAPYLWLLLVVAVSAGTSRDAGLLGTLGFGAIALPALLAVIGLILLIGSVPILQGPTDSSGHAWRLVVLGMAAMALCIGLMKTGYTVRSDLFNHFAQIDGAQLDLTGYALLRGGTLWGGALLIFALGWFVARRNLDKLLAPRA
jgi:hypothetical protein